jgi:hypothetical protein
MKGFGQLLDIFLLVGIQIVATEVDFRVDAIPESKIDSLKQHGVRNIDVDGGHDGSLSSYGFSGLLRSSRLQLQNKRNRVDQNSKRIYTILFNKTQSISWGMSNFSSSSFFS